MKKNKGITAWILTWESPNNYGSTCRCDVISVLDYRLGCEYVKKYAIQIYVDKMFYPTERIDAVKAKFELPFPVLSGDGGTLSIGHNPWIDARKIRNLRVKTIDGKEFFEWDEIDRTEIINKCRETRNRLGIM